MYALSGKRIWVAGHNGMVGRAVVRALEKHDCTILTAERADADLIRQTDVENWVQANKPDAVIVCAARVGGILANDTYPADFLYDNLMIEANIIRAAHDIGVEKLLFLGSSCIYPKLAAQPMPETALLTGPLEATNEWYAIAKITGIKLCESMRKQYGFDAISLMPTNLYGPGDNYHPENSHVLPALIRRFHEAKEAGSKSVTCWGTGSPLREFLHVDDLGHACVFALESWSALASDAPQDDQGNPLGFMNVGTGVDLTIKELAEQIAAVVGFEGTIEWDTSKPDGTPKKQLSIDAFKHLGWEAKITLKDGLRKTYKGFLASIATQTIRL